jgi:hypothetical protein
MNKRDSKTVLQGGRFKNTAVRQGSMNMITATVKFKKWTSDLQQLQRSLKPILREFMIQLKQLDFIGDELRVEIFGEKEDIEFLVTKLSERFGAKKTAK